MVFNLRTDSFASSVEGDPTPPESFSLKDLRVATHNFSKSNFLGETWSTKVYRGRLADGSLVAVRRSLYSWQRLEEWFVPALKVRSEVSAHPNVLRLRGFCITKKELFLVYPLMINNSLSYHLKERSDRFTRPLDWTTRKRIALEAARGLAHLHNQGNIKVMHRGFTPSNILLNGHFEAVIGDFALAVIEHERNLEYGAIYLMSRQVEGVSLSSPRGEISAGSGSDFEEETSVDFDFDFEEETSADSGFDSKSYGHYKDFYVLDFARGDTLTLMYMSPEYLFTGKCTQKNDVYAYGNTLLHLISGQSHLIIFSCASDENLSLNKWIWGLVKKNELGKFVDPNLQGNYVEEEAEQLVRLALLCLDFNPTVRPEMSEVVRILESQLLGRDHSSRSSWSRSECDSTPYYSCPASPSLEMSVTGVHDIS